MKFPEGAWVIVIFVPVMVVALVRLSKQYEREEQALEHDVPKAVAAPVRRRLVVMVFVDRLDLAVARAMQFGRALRPDELRAVHFVIDQTHAEHLAEEWREHGLANLGLELIDCPDRRLTRAAVEVVAHELSSGDAEVCVLLPERMYNGVWHRILHDQTAESLARQISRLPHANVTTVPFHFEEPSAPVPTVAGTGKVRGNGKCKVPTTIVTAATSARQCRVRRCLVRRAMAALVSIRLHFGLAMISPVPFCVAVRLGIASLPSFVHSRAGARGA